MKQPIQAHFFVQPEEIRAAFPQLLPILKRVPIVAEYRHEDLEVLALKGKLILGAATQGKRIKLVMAFEFIHYPAWLAVNIVALAGEDLSTIARAFFKKFIAWCQQAGAQVIEARCGEAMTRLLQRYGFNKAYNVVRMQVGE